MGRIPFSRCPRLPPEASRRLRLGHLLAREHREESLLPLEHDVALRCAVRYDPAGNAWEELPEMGWEPYVAAAVGVTWARP